MKRVSLGVLAAAVAMVAIEAPLAAAQDVPEIQGASLHGWPRTVGCRRALAARPPQIEIGRIVLDLVSPT